MKWTLSRKNNTFDLVELLKGRKILKNNWVIKLKQDNYKLVKHKAHSNLKGFGQNENFSLVIKSSSIWVVLGLATTSNLKIEQLDVKTNFLHGKLIEEIYMEQPKGFEEKGKEHMVLERFNMQHAKSVKYASCWRDFFNSTWQGILMKENLLLLSYLPLWGSHIMVV